MDDLPQVRIASPCVRSAACGVEPRCASARQPVAQVAARVACGSARDERIAVSPLVMQRSSSFFLGGNQSWHTSDPSGFAANHRSIVMLSMMPAVVAFAPNAVPALAPVRAQSTAPMMAVDDMCDAVSL